GSDRGGLLCPRRLSGVELAVALFDAASALVPSDDHADVVRAGSHASGGDFLLRLAGCQGKDLIPQRRRAALASRFSGYSALAPSSSRWRGCSRGCRWRLRCGHPFPPGALAVARQYTFGRFQFAELAGELVALRIDACECLADPLLLFSDLIQRRHFVPTRQSIS